MAPQLHDDIEEYQCQFDNVFVAGIPYLFNEAAGFLAFLSINSGIEGLAGLYQPKMAAGKRFCLFIEEFFPQEYKEYSEQLWGLRNGIVHSFNPGPFFALTSRVSRYHLKSPTNLFVHLNAENFYAALLFASRAYFEKLLTDTDLQEKFQQRVKDKDGGTMESMSVEFHPRSQSQH
jgi:hypothetical protein